MPIDRTSAATRPSNALDPYELEAATEILAMLTSGRLESEDCHADGDEPAPFRHGITGAMWF